jgi:hypothetical protein
MEELNDDIDYLHQRQTNVRFSELTKICSRWFGSPRINGTSHRLYSMPWSGDPRVNIQRDNNGMAKVYQVRQVIAALARLEEENGKA